MVALVVENPPANSGGAVNIVLPLGWEDPLEEEMAAHARILAWRTPWKRGLVGYSPQGCKESETPEAT